MGRDRLPDRCYRALLKLYPRAFRARFGDDMVELFRDRRRRARGARARLALWTAVAVDAAWQAIAVRREARAAGRAMSRETGRAMWARGLATDARDAWRSLVRRPGLSLVAVLTLGLGLAVGISSFALVHAVLLAPLPFHDPDRVVVLNARDDRTGAGDLASSAEVRAWGEHASSFDAVAGYAYRPVVMTPGGHEALSRAQAAVVTAGYFDVLPVAPLHGRLLGRGDEAAGAEPVAVVAHRFWQDRFAGDPAIVGRRIRIDRSPVTIVGILPPAFADISDVTGWNRTVDLWIPARAVTPAADGRKVFWGAAARLRPGVSLADARTDMDAVAARLAASSADFRDRGVRIMTAYDYSFIHVAGTLWSLLAAGGLVLLVGGLNVANLLLVRALAGERALALRAALGAGRWRLARRVVLEGVLLGLAAGAVGTLLAAWSGRLVALLDPAQIPRLAGVGLSPSVLAFALASAVAAGVVCGLVPAARVARRDPADSLRPGARGTAGAPSRALRGFATVQVAAAMVLLVATVLFVTGIRRLADVGVGFPTEGVVLARLDLGLLLDASPETRAREARALREQAAGLPGVRAAALWGPGLPGNSVDTVRLFAAAGPAAVMVTAHHVSAGALGALAIPIVRGRDVEAADRDGAAPVAVVSETVARELWPGQDPIGRVIRLEAGGTPITVIGVAGDVNHHRRFDGQARLADLYLPIDQRPVASPYLLAIGPEDAPALAGLVREMVARHLAYLPPPSTTTLDAVIDGLKGVRDLEVGTSVLSAFALAALALALVGIHGVLSVWVADRRREIGVRLALGETAGGVLRMVLGIAARLGLAGATLGGLAAFWLTRVLRGHLFGAGAADARMLAVAATLVVAVVAVAGVVPAVRAARTDPIETLRAD